MCMHAQLCPTLCNHMDCSLLGSSVHGIFQVRILEWVAISSSRGSSHCRDRTHVSSVSCIGRQILCYWATWEAVSVQFSSVAQLCPTLCEPMNHSTPGLPVHHQLPEFTQTHIHRVSDAIQPSHPLSTPSPPAPKSLSASESFPMSQLFAWVTKVLEFQLQHHSFQRNPRAGFLQNGLVGSPCSPSILFAYFFYIKILFPNFLALW